MQHLCVNLLILPRVAFLIRLDLIVGACFSSSLMASNVTLFNENAPVYGRDSSGLSLMVLSSGLHGRALCLLRPRNRDLLLICSTYRYISLSSFSAFFLRRAASINDLFEFILFLISFDSTINFLVCSLTSYPN